MRVRRDCLLAAALAVVKSLDPGQIVAEQRITLERARRCYRLDVKTFPAIQRR
jgi:hypothetical protein